MTHADPILVLWDVDRTLLYVGDIDRQVYREAFAEVVGRPTANLPARGTGVTGNLRQNALIKLSTFDLNGYVDTEIGGYASDDAHRPALVPLAQKRAQAQCGVEFARGNTVIIGDSLEDVRTGLEGGAHVIGVASGKTSVCELRDAGADVVLSDLTDVQALTGAITSLPGNV